MTRDFCWRVVEICFLARLAQKGWKVFLSRDAVGLLVDLPLSERCDSVERLYPAEKVVGYALG